MLGERHTFRSFDGEELYYHAAGSGPVMLLVNGFVCSTQYWPEAVEHFQPRFSVISWDYRGYGRNPPPRDMSTVGIEGATRDMMALLDHLGADQAVILGHSMGVQVVLEFYKHYPKRVRSIIALCGGYENPFASFSRSELIREFLARSSNRLVPHSSIVGALFRFLLSNRLAMEVAFRVGANRQLCPRHYIQDLFDHVSGMDFKVVLRSFESMVRHSAQEVLATVTVPTFIIGGERDGMTPPQRSEEMHRAVPGSECKVYTECTHLAMIEKHHEVMTDIDGFLARRVPFEEKRTKPKRRGKKKRAERSKKS